MKGAPILEPGLALPPEVTRSLQAVLCSTRTGIVSDLALREAPPDAAGDAVGTVMVTGRLAGGKAVGCNAFESGRAWVAAIGEAIERYAAITCVKWIRTRRMTPAEAMQRGALDPSSLASVAAIEVPDHDGFAPYDEAAPIDWVQGWKLHPGGTFTPAWLPAQVALAGYRPPPPETRFAWASTSGCGAGNTLAQAIRSGLTELIERDAFATAWLERRPVPHIQASSVEDPDVAAWIEHHRSRGREPSLAWLINDLGVPVVAAQIVDRQPGSRRRYLAGFGAGLDGRRAVRRAVEEAAQISLLMMHLERTGATPAPGASPQTLEEQALYWQDSKRLHLLDFLTQAPKHVPYEDLPQEATGTPRGDVLRLLDKLHRRGLDVFVLDITPPDVQHLPLRVAACIVPGLQPVRMANKPWCINNPRLAKPPEQLNRLPPPFA